jgi:hypothetical protein
VSPSVVLYPNPIANGQTLSVMVNEKWNGAYQVVAVSGQVVKAGKLVLAKRQTLTLPVNGWPAGTYFIRLLDEASSQTLTKKFLVQ